MIVKKHLSWYLINNYISLEAAKNLSKQINDLIKTLGEHSLEICEAFGLPKHTIHAPIYTGYEKYYSVDRTDGEHHSVPNRPKF